MVRGEKEKKQRRGDGCEQHYYKREFHEFYTDAKQIPLREPVSGKHRG